MTDVEIEKLAIDLANAKDVENNAKEARIRAEEALADAIGGKESGSTTVHVGRFGITVKRGFNYKIDAPKSFAEEYPDFVRRSERIEINSRTYEQQREANTELYREMAAHVTVTPKKTSVELSL